MNIMQASSLRRLKQRIGAYLIPRLPVNEHVFGHLRLEINCWWVRILNRCHPGFISARKRLLALRGASVNIGSSGTGTESWVNLDIGKHKGLSLRWDCRKSLPLSTDSVLRIRCEHVFEHLSYPDEVKPFLRECRRVLSPGGVLRIVVPDARRYLQAYCSGTGWAELGWDLRQLPEGFETPMDLVNHVFRQEHEHQYAYDFETLKLRLEGAGFRRVELMEFGKSLNNELENDQPVHRPYSLYVEAVK